MNEVILIGRLTRDPELSYTPNNQTAVTRFTLAVDRPVGPDRERQADFIRITAWGKMAETCDRYLAKGRQVAVKGRIQTGSYKNRDGQTVYTTDVVAERVQFLSSGNRQTDSDNHNQSDYQGEQSRYDDMPDTFQAVENDIPF